MNSERLIELAEECERAEGPSYVLDCAIWDAVYPGERDERFRKLTESGPYRGRLGPADKDGYVKPFRSFTASIDAAATLILEDVREWHAGKHMKGGGSAYILCAKVLRDPIYVVAETPALALTAAALRALAEKQG